MLLLSSHPGGVLPAGHEVVQRHRGGALPAVGAKLEQEASSG